MAPPQQRPFFANFLAAFRAHSAGAGAASARPLSNKSAHVAAASSSHVTTSTANPLGPRTPAGSASYTTSSPAHGDHTAPGMGIASPRSPLTSPHHLHPRRAHAHALGHAGSSAGAASSSSSTSPSSPSISPSSAAPHLSTTPSATVTHRRGSDSSSSDSAGGFRDVLAAGGEKWYIGGRTAHGDERYYRLGVVKRRRSGGSLSLDRLSL